MYEDVIKFWFDEIEESQWWKKDLNLDKTIETRFLSLHTQANACELFHWRDSAQGRLAEIIILDQFSRNIYRDTPKAFASDALALALAQEAINLGADQEVPSRQRSFFYLPFMHSESALIHEEAVDLYTKLGNPNNLEFEYKHKKIIDRFGRYPHRNAILGRDSTSEELAFLQEPDSSF